jgi:hypothetical protein
VRHAVFTGSFRTGVTVGLEAAPIENVSACKSARAARLLGKVLSKRTALFALRLLSEYIVVEPGTP